MADGAQAESSDSEISDLDVPQQQWYDPPLCSICGLAIEKGKRLGRTVPRWFSYTSESGTEEWGALCIHCQEEQWRSMEKTDETPVRASARAEVAPPEMGEWHNKTWQTISIKVANKTGIVLDENLFEMGPKIRM